MKLTEIGRLNVRNSPTKLGVEDKLQYVWEKSKHGYQLCDPNTGTLIAEIRHYNDVFKINFQSGSKLYRGIRPTLEQAFIDLDRLIYQKEKDIWLRTNVKAVIQPWMGNLNFGEE